MKTPIKVHKTRFRQVSFGSPGDQQFPKLGIEAAGFDPGGAALEARADVPHLTSMAPIKIHGTSLSLPSPPKSALRSPLQTPANIAQ